MARGKLPRGRCTGPSAGGGPGTRREAPLSQSFLALQLLQLLQTPARKTLPHQSLGIPGFSSVFISNQLTFVQQLIVHQAPAQELPTWKRP